MLKRWQVALLHVAPADLGVDEATRRMVQRNIGGSESAATMSAAGFAQVMAWWEGKGWADARNGRGYWAREAGDLARPMRAKAIKLADVLGWVDAVTGRVDFDRLDALAARQTSGSRTRLADCDRDDAFRVVEALKAMIARDPVAAARLAPPGGVSTFGRRAAGPRVP